VSIFYLRIATGLIMLAAIAMNAFIERRRLRTLQAT
jgi:hypothetical protein